MISNTNPSSNPVLAVDHALSDPGDSNELAKCVREFIQDARFIIERVDEFELSLKLARQRTQGPLAQPQATSTPSTTPNERK
jgi:hypothetical protein